MYAWSSGVLRGHLGRDRLLVNTNHHAAGADPRRGHLEPRSGRGAAVEHPIARVQQLLASVDLDELVRGPRDVALALGLSEIMIVQIARHRH